ncbi:hypothetical protein KDA_27350 [Dictyobacter alpinus]|uniref:Uncharacterized protein n=1 Tax=Dictyobacter alpinus TaxID=2014873 RepID=A0A402B7A1_9CHLR|nr:hypothetical protein [Dictyobacter alpinus]GCE27251.1 hypothetical protein KDA_27350 [Dictyobacter alpinus]
MNFKSVKPLIATLSIAALSMGASAGLTMPASAHSNDWSPKRETEVCSPEKDRSILKDNEVEHNDIDFRLRATVVCVNATANNNNNNVNNIHLTNKLTNHINIRTSNRPNFRNNNRIHNNNNNDNANEQRQALLHNNDD